MTVDIVFETHATSEDNERGIATGWLPGRLSRAGREQARELGGRRREDGLAAVLSSDLRRAAETVELAFAGSTVPVLHDWRLRECDYGRLNGAPTAEVHGDRRRYLDDPYPGGESWRQAVARVGRGLDDLPSRWDGARVLVVGHVATRWALDHLAGGRSARRPRRRRLRLATGLAVPLAAVTGTAHNAGMAITGAHALLYTSEPDAVRAIFRDVLGFDHVNAGEGWLIFALPPAELGVHPGEGPTFDRGVRHQLSLMCDDIEATVADLRARGLDIPGEPKDEGYGITATIVLPGGLDLMLYQPRHPTAI